MYSVQYNTFYVFAFDTVSAWHSLWHPFTLYNKEMTVIEMILFHSANILQTRLFVYLCLQRNDVMLVIRSISNDMIRRRNLKMLRLLNVSHEQKSLLIFIFFQLFSFWVIWVNCSENPTILKTFCYFHEF